MTWRDSLENSAKSESTSATPSNSSSAKPRTSRQLRQVLTGSERWRQVLELFRQRDLWDLWKELLTAERDAHSRASVYSNDEKTRLQHVGVVKWLDETIAGFFEESYVSQAHEALGMNQPPPDPTGGSAWMEDDGL